MSQVDITTTQMLIKIALRELESDIMSNVMQEKDALIETLQRQVETVTDEKRHLLTRIAELENELNERQVELDNAAANREGTNKRRRNAG